MAVRFSTTGCPSSEADNVFTWRGVLATPAEAEPLKDEGIAHIFSSTLPRAHQTAMLVVGAIGRGIPISLHPEIEEICPHPHEPHDEKPYESDASQDLWKSDINAAPCWGTESQLDVYRRTGRFLRDVVAPRLLAGDTVLIVSHYFAIRGMRALIEHGDPTRIPDYRPRNSRPIIYRADIVLERLGKAQSSFGLTAA
jgi:broad specificity phosphatase PhoE